MVASTDVDPARTFDHREPWQSFDALVELRNMIVHLHPETRPPKAVTSLVRAKNLGNKFFGSEELTTGFNTAAWPINTVALMFEELTRLVDLPEPKIDVSWIWNPRYFPRGLSTPGNLFPSPE
jgi:hypothetical protein